MKAIALAVAALLIAGFCYQTGYQDARDKLANDWYEGPEGYCLADAVPHPGDCNER